MKKRGFANFAQCFYSRPPALRSPSAPEKISSRNSIYFKSKKLKFSKRGDFLVGEVMFIILNVVFLSIIILFLNRQASGDFILEESYAKQIALIADYAKPEMMIKIDMEKGMKIAGDNNYDFSKSVIVDGNVVYVKLREKGGYSYSFFNDVDVKVYPDKNENNEYTGLYVLTVAEKSGGENEK